MLRQGCRGSAVLMLPGGLNTGSVMNTLNSRADATLGALFLAFAKIGLFGIGSLLAWMHRVIVEERHWMSEAEFAETLSLCQFLPGPENANISIYVGAKFRGPVGATVALLGLTAAPLAVGLVLGTLYLRYPHPAVIQKILAGLCAATAGLLIATGIRRQTDSNPRSPKPAKPEPNRLK